MAAGATAMVAAPRSLTSAPPIQPRRQKNDAQDEDGEAEAETRDQAQISDGQYSAEDGQRQRHPIRDRASHDIVEGGEDQQTRNKDLKSNRQQ